MILCVHVVAYSYSCTPSPDNTEYFAGEKNPLGMSQISRKFDPCDTVDSRYSSFLKYGHLDIPAIWLGTE